MGNMKNITKQPLVSVVMPAYNAGPYVADAIQSILDQTYRNLELIIVDDGSTDGTFMIAKRYQALDKRVIVLKNDRNLGVSMSAKKGINKAKGTFIARMDADDIAIRDRFEKQVAYLEKNINTVAVGGYRYMIDKKGKTIGRKQFPESFEEIYDYIFKFIPVQQGTFMIARTRLPKDFVYYEDGMNTAEEVELFFKLFQYGRVENMSEYLLKYRMHNKNTSIVNLRRTFFLTLISRIKAIYRYGYTPSTSGVILTVLQALIVLSMPTRLSMALYTSIRWMKAYALPTVKLSPISLTQKVNPAL
jgi:glycosyltransferase involved in cell wall biosynthesis